jgi:hypothetical protein
VLWFKADTMHNLVSRLDEMSSLLVERRLEELSDEIDNMRENLRGALQHYEFVCEARGIALPYTKFPKA